MFEHAIRNVLLIAALGALPGLAAAQGSQAGDNGREPVGADADSPRQAIPNQMTNNGTGYSSDHRIYLQAHDPGRYRTDDPVWNCEQQPLAERPACRDALYDRDRDRQGDRRGPGRRVPAAGM